MPDSCRHEDYCLHPNCECSAQLRCSAGTVDELWRIFNEAHDAVSQTEPGKARRAGFDAVMASITSPEPQTAPVLREPTTSEMLAIIDAEAGNVLSHDCDEAGLRRLWRKLIEASR